MKHNSRKPATNCTGCWPDTPDQKPRRSFGPRRGWTVWTRETGFAPAVEECANPKNATYLNHMELTMIQREEKMTLVMTGLGSDAKIADVSALLDIFAQKRQREQIRLRLEERGEHYQTLKGVVSHSAT